MFAPLSGRPTATTMADLMIRRMVYWRQGLGVLGVVLFLTMSPAWGQQAPTRGGEARPQTPATESSSIPATSATGIANYPLELLGLLAPPQQGQVALTPSISISEEYNDNIFANNQDRQWDFITTFSPAIILNINRPTYELSAGYSFGADIYARDSSLNNALARQNFIASGLFRLTPTLTLSVLDSFAYSDYSLVGTQSAFSTGRQKSWSNNFVPSMTWQMTARNSLSMIAGYDVIRYLSGDTGIDSDTYTIETVFTHAFTPRFAGSVGYQFTYLAPGGQQDDAASHNPTVGFSYQVTQTLTAAVRGGPAITIIAGDTTVTPAGYASLVQLLPFGSASLRYDRRVATQGGFGGTNDTQTASGTLSVSSLMRGLVILASPSYTHSEPIGPNQVGQETRQSVNLFIGANYQLARFTTIFGGYTFFWQRSQGSSTTAIDVDQNRVRIGIQFGYPINFE
jgi:hypothetical protein